MKKLPPMNVPEGNPFADPATWPAPRQYDGIQNQSWGGYELRKKEAYMRSELVRLESCTPSWFDVFRF